MKAKFDVKTMLFQIQIIISNLVNVLTLFSIHFTTYGGE